MDNIKVNRRLTKQKTAILEYLKSTKTHPDAETVHEVLKENMPNISLSTVYRNLSLLSEEGLISKLSFGGMSDHFDGDVSLHQHFLCEKCGKILDVNCKIDLKDEGLGEISSYSVYFYGICKECKCVK